MTEVAFITAARVHELYRKATGASAEGARAGCVEGAVANAGTAARYARESDEPDPLLIAAYLLRSLAKNHCYVDGNKRVAWLACLEVLAVGASVTVEEDQEAAAMFVESVATGALDVEGVVHWLADRLVGPLVS